MCSQITTEKKIEYYQQLLDRCIAFIVSCDNKASFALAIDGVLIGVVAQKISAAEEANRILQYNPQILCYSITALVIASILLLAVIVPRMNPFKKNNFLIECKNSIETERTHLENLSAQIDKNASIYSRKCVLCALGFLSMALGAVLYLVPFL